MSKSKDASFDMWGYYKSTYHCRLDALESQYPELLKKRKDLQHAVMTIRMAERAIDSIMAEEHEKEND